MQFTPRLKHYIASAIVTSGMILSATTYAGAFQLWEQDASDTSNYHAGAAAEADRAGTEFYNPAGMTRLKHQEVSMGGAMIDVNATFNGNIGATPPLLPVTDASGDSANIVPNFHYVLPFANDWAFGLGITSPFGLETDYDSLNPAGALATKTELLSVNVNPSVAYQINHYLSLGVGFDALYGRATYDSNPLQQVFPTGYEVNNKLDGTGYGYNLGALVQFTPATRVGLSYRSAITIDAKGHSSSAIPTFSFTTFTFVPQALSSSVSAKFNLPATTTMSIYHDMSSRWDVMASTFYTQWSVFNQLVLNNVSTPLGVQTITVNEKYRDTWNFAVGSRYKVFKHLWLDGGLGHDETPTRDTYRDIRLPDGDRYALSLGFDVQPKEGVMWSTGWTHFFIPNVAINNSQSTAASSGLPVGVGTEKGEVNVIGMQLSFDIDR